MRPYCQYRIQKQHSLLRPFGEASVIRDRASQIIVKLLINIDKRRRNVHSRPYGKAEPVCLPLSVIRILSQYHHLHLMKRRQVERIENVVRRRENLPRPVLLVDRLK